MYFSLREVAFLDNSEYDAQMDTGFDRETLLRVFSALGDVLQARGHRIEVVLVGGGDLLLQGFVSRPTRDADVLGERLPDGRVVPLRRLPATLERAVADVALAFGLASDWLNLGPESLLDLGLPPGFETRLARLGFGALTVWLADRYDLICFKLYAAADHWPTRDRHLGDLIALGATVDELRSAATWTRTHDSSPAFRDQLGAVLGALGIDLADVADL